MTTSAALSARTPTRSGVAFAIVHLGTEALWVNTGWWELDILYQRLPANGCHLLPVLLGRVPYRPAADAGRDALSPLT
jgi:hypothetical protein